MITRTPKTLFAGFSLVELMLSITISLLAFAGIFAVFSTSIKASASSLREISLNQELRVVMDVMARDIRRAGYWSLAEGNIENPFFDVDTELSVPLGSCITYSYDVNGDNVVDHNDNQGFKLVRNAITIRKTSASCFDRGGHKWESISDLNTLDITALNFDVKNVCINLTNRGRSCDLVPLPNDNRFPGLSGDNVEIMPVVVISMSGQLKVDAGVIDSLTETVAVRNTFSETIP